ncbi:MAG: alpha-N-arabinofuranosidase [Butyrivibrio sp.]|uniref:alpha-N-arabinofuranosidase n=1 Tax=Butyrivibrio sp. TaxID=28121 RepID=UPI001B4EA55C|nr:alpha-L-arabinofuranosidase C-terminal domain-containing protein [Butyrivibrio sp.]MBP3784747.1 alpha-N-arabinofuranosidase [Butyrivibrio sp.]
MAKLVINETKKLGTVAPEIYGHFSEHLGRCIYEGLYVGENSDIPNVNGMRKDVVDALKEIQVPVLRWPGGCFADEYHWKDGIGEKSKRKKMVNTHWGGVTEDNSFGTHEYMELCKQLGCKTYVNGNLGSGTVQEMSEWVEYMTFDGESPMSNLRKENGSEKAWTVDYFGVGNENWGCGGNMTPEYYGNEYRRYQTYVRQYDDKKPIKKICCGANVDDYHWTEQVLKTCFDHAPEHLHGFMDLLSLHYYDMPFGWEPKVSATEFDEDVYYRTLKQAYRMEELVSRHSAIMDQYDPEKKIGMSVDEWGTWYKVEEGTNPGFLYQQNTVRDALVAGITLNIFNKHCDRVKLACIAQMINVLQSVILTDGEKMLRTPTYHVFHQYRHHQGAELLESSLSGTGSIGEGATCVPEITESVTEKDGVINITLCNLSMTDSKALDVQLAEDKDYEVVEAAVVGDCDPHNHNTFENPDLVVEKAFDGCKKVAGNKFTLNIPAASVVEIRLK